MLQIIGTEKEEGLVIGAKTEGKISAEISLKNMEVREISKSYW